ncbi:nickel insertion protein [Candidatus Avoscillospira sp. LCP25S3_F1]|uniref:nickel insertion protein n=1 Tax=Candidatus Avoscillospira sp. LCP25S3_F1 TaxID=3438825 RepID=UPI003F92A835
MDLRDFFSTHPRPAVAFSGGADSAFLLWSAVRYGVRPTAYYVETSFQTDAEGAEARRLAEALSVPLRVIRVDALAQDGVAANGPRRCYFCKQAIFTAILAQAAADGCGVVLEGTNASDDVNDRPGWQALQELGVLSPLRLCGLTKETIRRLSREAGLPTWDKPAAACLATRVPTGTPITPEALDRVARAEAAVAALGFSDFRVRLTAEGCRLELTEPQLVRAVSLREALVETLSPLVGKVSLDLTPRQSSVKVSDGFAADMVAELQCNLDDMTGEDIAFASSRLLDAGALDVWTAPIYMKKNRPAVLLTCLCPVHRADEFTRLMLRHTTTLGVRRRDCERTVLHRSVTQRDGIRFKCAVGHGIAREKAEFDDLAARAIAQDCTLAEVRKALELSTLPHTKP